MKIQNLALSAIASLVLINSQTLAKEIILDPIVVSSDFRSENLSKTSNTVSVISYDQLVDKASQPFEEVIGQIPNVNYTQGASRAHYIQIRGIGERSQFKSPINPSVGLIIDGIDVSDSALALSMFDIAQIEVLKGPQGTTFGSNGMAGVVSLQSNEPSEVTEGKIEATIGNYDTKALGFAVGGSLIENKLLARFSAYKNTSDGFMKNKYLNKNNTQNIDELTAKAHFKYLASDEHTIDINLMHVNVDNGYDAFTFDNSFNTYSDEPGTDAQETNALAIKSNYQLNKKMHLESKASFSKSDSTYSYDGDWAYEGFFSPEKYVYIEEYIRERKKVDLDLRLVSDEEGRIFNNSTDWIAGIYYKKQNENLVYNEMYKENSGDYPSSYKSSFDTKNFAGYGQLDSTLSNKLVLTTGLRVEKWDAKFNDSDNLIINTNETLVGGKVGLSYQENENSLYYVTLSKGYKPGGVNANNSLAVSERAYKTEHLWNLDLGRNFSSFENKLKTRINAFYGIRKDQQVKKYDQENQKFEDWLVNAAEGRYYGLEVQMDYFYNNNFHMFASLGLLKSEFDEYKDTDKEGRTPAQSPEYQYNIGFDYLLSNNITFKVDVEGKDSYYFSNTHNGKSKSYSLLNSSITYEQNNWTFTLWGKNLTDKRYETRGFYFDNNPNGGWDNGKEEYTQQGTPRTFGFTVSYNF